MSLAWRKSISTDQNKGKLTLNLRYAKDEDVSKIGESTQPTLNEMLMRHYPGYYAAKTRAEKAQAQREKSQPKVTFGNFMPYPMKTTTIAATLDTLTLGSWYCLSQFAQNINDERIVANLVIGTAMLGFTALLTSIDALRANFRYFKTERNLSYNKDKLNMDVELYLRRNERISSQSD